MKLRLYRIDTKYRNEKGQEVIIQSAGEKYLVVQALLDVLRTCDIEWLEIGPGCKEHENTKEFRY